MGISKNKAASLKELKEFYKGLKRDAIIYDLWFYKTRHKALSTAINLLLDRKIKK